MKRDKDRCGVHNAAGLAGEMSSFHSRNQSFPQHKRLSGVQTDASYSRTQEAEPGGLGVRGHSG